MAIVVPRRRTNQQTEKSSLVVPESCPVPKTTQDSSQKSSETSSLQPTKTDKSVIDFPKEVSSYGINPYEKILINDNDGESLRYIRGETPDGQLVLIDLDVNGSCQTCPSDISYSKKQPQTSIREMFPLDDLLFIKGVALQCDSGMCVVDRSGIDYDEFDLSENISHSNRPIIGLPIILYSDLKSSPRSVIKKAEESARVLQNRLSRKYTNDIVRLTQDVEEMSKSYKNLVDKTTKEFTNLSESIGLLREYNDEYNSMKDLSEEDKEKHDVVISNLKKRTYGVSNLMNILQKITETRETIVQLRDKYDRLNSILSDALVNVENVQ